MSSRCARGPFLMYFTAHLCIMCILMARNFVTNLWHNPELTSDPGFLRSASSHWLSVFEVKGAVTSQRWGHNGLLCAATASQMPALPQWMWTQGDGKARVGDHAAG